MRSIIICTLDHMLVGLKQGQCKWNICMEQGKTDKKELQLSNPIR